MVKVYYIHTKDASKKQRNSTASVIELSSLAKKFNFRESTYRNKLLKNVILNKEWNKNKEVLLFSKNKFRRKLISSEKQGKNRTYNYNLEFF